MTEAYPLRWPVGWPRAKEVQYSNFKVQTFERARIGVMQELDRLGADNVVISTNLELRRDGFPYSGRRQPEDRGVAIYFRRDGEDQCIPCDKWSRIEDNMRAIEKTIEALRGLDRWGAKETVNAAFRGFKALPESVIVTPYTARAWHEVLEVSPTASPEVVRAAYKQMALKHHPDRGGSDAGFQDVQRAWDEYQGT